MVGGGDDRAPGHRLDKDGEYERGINAIVGFRPSDGTWRASPAPAPTTTPDRLSRLAGEGPKLCPEAIEVHPGYGPFALALGDRIYTITMAHASMWSWCPTEVRSAEPARPPLLRLP